jgi:signal transduction histidine kinase
MSQAQKKTSSLLWRLLLSTSLAVTAVFAATGWMVQRYTANVSQHSLEEEIRTSLQAYQSLWSARAHTLTSVSRIVSSMSDVRAAFMTHDRATIRDTAEQLWAQVSEQNANFLVLEPTGAVIASLGGDPNFDLGAAYVAAAVRSFPKQVSGYVKRGQHLYYTVLTPVYVQSGSGQALLNILLVAFQIDDSLAHELKQSTHGSDFAFISSNDVMASTFAITAAELRSARNVGNENVQRASLHGGDYLLLSTDLRDALGNLTGQLFVIRSFAGPQTVLAELQRNVAAFWAIGIIASLALTYLLSRRILEPVERLDRAAGEVIRRNYDYRVPVETNDELGRLARTFNDMCDSIRKAREELIRQEQISTIARLSTSIVHDLRNPLAAIYGGAEMLVDADLSPEHYRRLAASIYRASHRIQELLQDLLDVSRVKNKPLELCGLQDMAESAREALGRTAALQGVSINSDLPAGLNIMASRDRLERVFVNLLDNAIDAMPGGGTVTLSVRVENAAATVAIEDNGPGIPAEAWSTLFEPFASFGKKNGLGLGLALSRQTALDHGGDLWAEKNNGSGARFLLRLPLAVHANALQNPSSGSSNGASSPG